MVWHPRIFPYGDDPEPSGALREWHFRMAQDECRVKAP